MEIHRPENIEVAIQHFIQGNTSIEEEKLLLDWLNKNPENKKILFAEKDLWEGTQIGSDVLNKIETQQWNKLQNRIASSQTKSVRIKEILRIAASVIIALGIGWMGHSFYSANTFSNSTAELRHIDASKGQIKEIFLADGTHVWLNADSKLSFPSNFSDNQRRIELSGEAYFEVTANEKKPFFVKTQNHTVKVTGTKFNICQYPEDKKIETTLEEGKVKIISGNLIRDLHPGQQSTFYTETEEILIGENDFDIYTTWKDGRYEFRNESIVKIFKIMERWWDVEIEYDINEFNHEYISGVLRKHKPIKQHFETINALVPITYHIENDQISVKLK